MYIKKKKGLSRLAAARILGVESTTLGKEATRIKNGDKPLSKKQSVIFIAEMYASGKTVTEADVRKAALLDGTPPTTWPHPSEEMSVSQCASALGISPKTMNAAVKKAEAGVVANGRVGACAAIFAKLPPAGVKKALCSELMNAAGISASEAAPEQKKRRSSKRPKRVGKRERAMLARITAKQRQDKYNKAAADLRKKNTPTRRIRFVAVFSEIRLQDGEDSIPSGLILNIKAGDIRVFASLEDWITRARPEDPRIFLVFKGRPYDYSTAPEKVLVGGRFKAMVLAEFAKMVLEAAAFEAAKTVGEVVEGAMKVKVKKTKGRGGI